MIRYKCSKCNSVLESPDEKIGQKVFCPKCQQKLQVPNLPENKTVLASFISKVSGPNDITQSGIKSNSTIVNLEKVFRANANWILHFWKQSGSTFKLAVIVGSGILLFSIVLCCGIGGFLFMGNSRLFSPSSVPEYYVPYRDGAKWEYQTEVRLKGELKAGPKLIVGINGTEKAIGETYKKVKVWKGLLGTPNNSLIRKGKKGIYELPKGIGPFGKPFIGGPDLEELLLPDPPHIGTEWTTTGSPRGIHFVGSWSQSGLIDRMRERLGIPWGGFMDEKTQQKLKKLTDELNNAIPKKFETVSKIVGKEDVTVLNVSYRQCLKVVSTYGKIAESTTYWSPNVGRVLYVLKETANGKEEILVKIALKKYYVQRN